MLATLRPRVVCFGHGPPLTAPQALDDFAAHLDQRMAAAKH
jgi:hypothetical protein